MKSHASMNRIYRLVWNAALGIWVAVAENAKGRGKSGRAAGALLAVLAILSPSVYAADAAHATVVVGTGSVATQGLNTTINQVSQRLAIDWTQLSTAANEALRFNQPNAQAIALNRIIGSSPSSFLGSLTANGQVFILNPNGILFGAGSQVNVGGLVASTLAMSNADFQAGRHVFTNSGGTGSVVNQGNMTAAQGGYLALLAPEVRNEGVMTASLGTALLAAGNKVTLNLDNGSLLGYSIDQGAINALAENKQLIKADGGQVLLSAKALDALTTATVNNTGVIEARTIQNKAGRILLMGDMKYGTVNIGGTLDASAPNGGDGGFIETSAANFKILPGLKVNARAALGKTGTWLLDPTTATIAAGTGGAANTFYEDMLEIAGADVAIQATDSINVAGTFSNGDVVVPSGLNLTLQTTGTSGSGIDLTGSAHGAGLEFKTSGGGSVLMSTSSAGQSLKVSKVTVADAGTITLTSQGILDVTGTALQTAGGALTLSGSSVKIAAANVDAGGGNIGITGSGSSATHSVEIANSGATRSNVTTTGSGNISISGNLSSGGASGSAGVKVIGSTISTGTGNIDITGTASVAQLSRGFLIDADNTTSTTITGGGNITLTGTANNGALTNSAGGELARYATVTSSGGNVALTGTLYSPSVTAGNGLLINGKVQSGATKKITLTGTATVGGGAGTGVYIGSSAELIAGLGGLTIVGSVNSATTATAIIGASVGGSASSTGAIAINGIVGAPSAANATGVVLNGGTLSGLGAASITITGSGVPAPAPAANYDVNLQGTVVSTAGGDITLLGNRMNISSSVNSGTGRTMIAPTTAFRRITLGGSSETLALNLNSSEIGLITAAELQIGAATNSGGITISGTGGTLAPAPGQLPFINLLTDGSIAQTAGVKIAKLKAVGASVSLNLSSNELDEITGQANSGSFSVTSSKAGPLTVGPVTASGNVTIEATAGDMAVGTVTGNAVNLTAGNGAITDNNGSSNNITATTLTASSKNGIDLGTNVSGLQSLTTTGATGYISIATANAINTANYLFSTAAGAQNISLSTSSASGITIGNAFASTDDNISLTASAGNITLNSAISANGLTLSAQGNISAPAAITVANVFDLQAGTFSQTGTLPTFSATDFRISGGTFIRALSGNGSLATPYQLTDVYGLQGGGSAGMLGNYYKLANNVNASGTTNWNSSGGFKPIGDGTTAFSGSFDGNSKTVSGLTINRPTTDNVGLFGATASSAAINDLGLVGGNVAGNNNVGALVGRNQASVSNSYASTNTTGAGDAVGGLIGLNGDGTSNGGAISNSYAAGTVAGVNHVGGLIGQSNSGAVNSSHATGAVTSTAYAAGGLIGFNGNANTAAGGSDVSGSYATGNVTGANIVGGLIGASNGGAITNSYYTTGTVTALSSTAGGLMGSNRPSNNPADGIISNSYNTGNVSGNDQVGGLVGNNSGIILNSYSTGTVTSTSGSAGGLVAINDGGVISNAYSTSIVNGSDYSGGLVGFNGNGSISNSYSIGSVNGGAYTGGLVGQNGGGVISNSYSIGNVSGNFQVGGLVGVNENSSINNSYSTGSVNGNGGSYNGGLVGLNTHGSSISNAYSIGNVDGANFTGGLVGSNVAGTSISNTYSTGNVNGHGSGNTGGLVGRNAGTVNSSFWNTQTSGQASSAGGTGKTTTEMMQATTFTGWDMASAGGSTAVWRIYEGHTSPLLRSFLTARTLTDTAVTYNGGIQTVTAAGALITDASGRNAGTYASYSTQQGYDLSGGDLIIDKASLTLAAVTDSKTYNGSAASSAAVSKTGLMVGDSVTSLSQTFASKNALGTGNSMLSVDAGYTVADGNSGGNYNVTTATAQGTINKVTLSVTGVAASNKTYNGNDVATLSSIGTLSGLVSGEALTLSQTAATFDNKNFGIGKVVTATGYGIADGMGGLTSNYQLASTSATANANVDKAALTVTASAVTRDYNGTTTATGAGTVSTLAGAAALETVNSSGSQAFVDKNAGMGKTVNASGVTIKDAGNLDVTSNYDITYVANNTSVINKVTLRVTGVAASNKTYNGTDVATLSSIGTLSGLVIGEALTLSQTAATFDNKNAGIGKTVTAAGYGIANGTGGLASNYQLASTSATTSANIDKAALTVMANAVTKTYDSMLAATGSGTVGTLAGVAAGEVVNTAGTQAFLDKNFGIANKTVRASGVTIKDSGNVDVTGNYNITYADNTVSTINKATLNISATPENKVYDGTTMATARYTDNRIAGDMLAYTTTSSFADKNVANGIAVTVGGITTSGADAGNYTVGTSIVVGNTADITPKTLTVTANDATHQGGTPYSGGNGVVYSGFVAGETSGVLRGTLAYSGDSQGASNGGQYEIVPGGLNARNYSLDFVEGTLTVKSADAATAALGKPALVGAYTSILSSMGSLGGDAGGGSGGGGAGGSGGGAGGGGANSASNALNAAANDSGGGTDDKSDK